MISNAVNTASKILIKYAGKSKNYNKPEDFLDHYEQSEAPYTDLKRDDEGKLQPIDLKQLADYFDAIKALHSDKHEARYNIATKGNLEDSEVTFYGDKRKPNMVVIKKTEDDQTRIIVAFKGTASFSDLRDNLDVKTNTLNSLIKGNLFDENDSAHSGFARHFQKIGAGDLLAKLETEEFGENSGNVKLEITGFSQGAAMATIFATAAVNKGIIPPQDISVTTFACPPVLTNDTAKKYNAMLGDSGVDFKRFEGSISSRSNEKLDPVPLLGHKMLPIGEGIYLNKSADNGVVEASRAVPPKAFCEQPKLERVSLDGSILSKLKNKKNRTKSTRPEIDFRAHSIGNYSCGIKENDKFVEIDFKTTETIETATAKQNPEIKVKTGSKEYSELDSQLSNSTSHVEKYRASSPNLGQYNYR